MEPLINYVESDYGMVTLNRLHKHNAINMEMAIQLKRILNMAKTKHISFLVITGSGDDSFCAGGDLVDFHSTLTEEEAYERLMSMNQVLYDILTFPVPTICLLNGNALGGGCEIASACDIRIAREGTKFGYVQSNIGILPGWGGGAILYERVKAEFAYHWLLTGNVYEAEYLVGKGWLQHIVPNSNWGQLDKILSSYLNKSKKQMHMLKGQFIELMKKEMENKMHEETKNCSMLWGSETHQKHVKMFLKK